MPPLPNVPGVIKTIFKHGLGTGENLVNLLYWKYGGTLTDAIITDFAHTLFESWGTNVMPLLSEHCTLEEVTAEDLTSDTAPTGFDSGSIAGSDASSSLPNNAAALVSKEIARRYRGGHPRTYFGSVGESKLVSADHFDTTFINDLAAALLAVSDDGRAFTEGGVTIDDFVNVSYHSGGVLRPVPVVDSIVNIIGKPRVCTQRRRLGKAGG